MHRGWSTRNLHRGDCLSKRKENKMRNWALKWILLGIYLILVGLSMLGVSLGGNILNIVGGLCALIAGILFIINR